LEAMNSSRSCPASSNLKPLKPQARAFDEFPISLSKQSYSIDKGNGVGSQFHFQRLFTVQRVEAILPLLVRLRYLRHPDK
jgi:hypothetical protein